MVDAYFSSPFTVSGLMTIKPCFSLGEAMTKTLPSLGALSLTLRYAASGSAKIACASFHSANCLIYQLLYQIL